MVTLRSDFHVIWSPSSTSLNTTNSRNYRSSVLERERKKEEGPLSLSLSSSPSSLCVLGFRNPSYKKFTDLAHIVSLRFQSFSICVRVSEILASLTDRTHIVLGRKMVAQEFTVDLNKPLVFQVGHLGEAYQEWVHQPIVTNEGPRFFESDFWEFLTLTAWWVIPLIWLPVVCWSISLSVRMGQGAPQIALMVAFGILVWSLLEYTLHRFLFHIETKSYWGNTFHYLLHGCHHKHPMDGLRLVFPPAATAILCFPFWNLIKIFSTPSTTPALFGGGLLGYVMYDVTHYYLHHSHPTREVTKNLKKYHLNHHFRIQNKGFGITSSLWDKVFGTLPQTKSAEKKK